MEDRTERRKHGNQTFFKNLVTCPEARAKLILTKAADPCLRPAAYIKWADTGRWEVLML